MNKTLIGHLDVSSSNLKDLAYKIYKIVKDITENLDTVDKTSLIYMLKTYRQAMEITLSDFEFVYTETPTDDKLYPYMDYLSDLMQYAFSALDELIYIVEKEFDGSDDAFKNIIKETLSYLQDIIYCVHNWIKELRNQIENEGTNQEKNESDNSSSEED